MRKTSFQRIAGLASCPDIGRPERIACQTIKFLSPAWIPSWHSAKMSDLQD